MTQSVFICSVALTPFKKEGQAHIRPTVKPDGSLKLNERNQIERNSFHDYILPPADPDKGYSVLEIQPYWVELLDRMHSGPGEPGMMIREESPLPLAQELVSGWRSTLAAESGFGPGIGIIAGIRPTAEELADLRAQHVAWCRYLVNQADMFWAVPENRKRIGDEHRGAAVFLKLQNSPDHAWVRNLTPDSHKDCLFCGEAMKSTARGCGQCGKDQAAYALEIGLTDRDVRHDAFLAAEVARMRKAKPKGVAA